MQKSLLFFKTFWMFSCAWRHDTKCWKETSFIIVLPSEKKLRVNTCKWATESVLHSYCFLKGFIFPQQYFNMTNRPVWRTDVYPWISNSCLSKTGHDWPGTEQMPSLFCCPNLSGWAKQLEMRRGFHQSGLGCSLHFNNLLILSFLLYLILL